MSNEHQQPATTVGETHQASGKLEADVGAYLDQQLASVAPGLVPTRDPQARRPLRAEVMAIRSELRHATQQTLAVRRTALKKMLLADFLKEDCELRNLGLAYAPCEM
ncbi:unnamed protein product [Plutella xylostella]|uniref:(diamondback moth) hypothetical protein n=1 Tax=Plutella xylostella TaxID=51655 RepID=A0A8S4G7F0_PLUXY|nr:unnamed protein product [Plutella xylostella]